MKLLLVVVSSYITLFMSGAAVADQERLPNLLENEHQLSTAFETPHTKWAKPYAGGTTRVLFFTPWYQGSTEGRETIELMQRFDLQADATYYLKGPARLLGDGNPRPYVYEDAGTQRVLRLLTRPYDVFFLNQVEFRSLPEKVQKNLLKQVAGGAGMVIVNEKKETPFDNASQMQTPQGLDDSFACFSVGQGRAVVLPPRRKLEFAVGWEVELDRQFAEQGRALLWAAGKEPRVAVDVQLSAAAIERPTLTDHSATITWDKAVEGAKLQAVVRRWDGEEQALGTVEISNERSASFPLPILRAGKYHFVAIAGSDRGIENWSFEPLEVTSDAKVTEIVLERNWGEPGDTLRGKALLDGTITSRQEIQVRLVDTNGRILVRKDIETVDSNVVAFELPTYEWMPMLLRVEAAILEKNEEVSSAYAFARVTNCHQDQFNFVVWNWPSGDLAPFGLESFARHGVTAVLQGGEPSYSMAASNLSFVPYTTSFRMSSHTVTAMLDSNGIMKNGCINDPAVMEKWISSVVERQHEARRHGVLVYSLGDENAVRASCLSEDCLVAYQRYLEQVYGNIESLNEEWESDYPSFDAVELLEGEDLPAEDAPRWFKEFFAQRLQKNLTDNEGDGLPQSILGDKNDELLALQAENYARWYDRQAFQCDNYVQWCKRFAEAFRQLDPKSLTGFEGTDSFSLRRLTTRSRQGGDLDAFVRGLEYFGPYRGPANEVVRSIAPPKFPMGNWIGYSMNKEVLLKHYWDQIANCMNTVQWWRWDNLDGYHGFLSPTFSPFPGVQEFLDDTQVVRDGLGNLLMHCTMHDDNVAMLYSMPSTHIAHFDGNRTYCELERDHGLWHKAIHDSGVQFSYVTDRMLRLGEFDADRFKVLVLPLSFAIGPEEAKVIREYVRNGGTLLADVRPGVYDGHCKPLKESTLDDVFGIKRSGKQNAVKLDRLALEGKVGNETVSMRWGNWYGKEIYPRMKADPTVTTTTGEALGQAFPIHYWAGLNHPVCIVNEFGQGRAVLFNFPIYNAPAQPLIEGILASAGVRAKIQVHTPEGNHITGLEVTRWQNGDIELLALLGDYDGDVVVSLPEQRHVYNLKTHKEFGETDKFETAVRPNRATFFALLPKPALRPQLTLPVESAATGSVVPLQVSIPEADGHHSVKLMATTPTGKTADWFRQSVVVDSKPQTVEFPIAFNDTPGEWIIHVEDLYTSTSSSVRLTVGKQKGN